MGKGSRNRQARSNQKAQIGRDIVNQVAREVERDAIKQFLKDETACILWALHVEFGFGKDRLKRFYDRYAEINEELRKYYEWEMTDLPYIAREKLKDIGVDLEEWCK